MSIDTDRELKRAFDYGLPFWGYPLPIVLLTPFDFAHIWGSYIVPTNPIPESPYYIPDHLERTIALFIEEFKRKEEL